MKNDETRTVNVDRQAVQILSPCSSDVVISHYPLPSDFVAQVQEEDSRVFTGVLAAVSAIKRRDFFATKSLLD